MSISNISPTARTLSLGQMSSLQNTARSHKDGGAFAAMLSSAREVDQVSAVSGPNASPVHQATLNTQNLHQVNNTSPSTIVSTPTGQNANPIGLPAAQFASVFAAAQNQYGSTDAVNRDNLNNTAINVRDAILRSDFAALGSASPTTDSGALDLIDAITAAQAFSFNEIAQSDSTSKPNASAESMVNLEHHALDFSTLLPVGMRNFIHDLKCPESELNNFINVMIFGSEDGPQGQNAASYFGANSLSSTELSERMHSLLDGAKINSADVKSGDYNFILRPEGTTLGNTLALQQGADLDQRSLERELENTFQRDMTLMQVLARSNNQSANIF